MIENYKLTKRNWWLVFLHVVAILLITYCMLILKIFATPASIDYHLSKSGGYVYITEMVKAEIEDRLPPEFDQKILQRALADNLINNFITPQTVQRLSRRLLNVGQRVLNKPIEINDEKIVANTKNFKDELTTEISQIQVPEIFKNAATNIVTAVPETLVLVDLEQRPNSVLGFMLKAEKHYARIAVINNIAIFLAVLSFLLLIILNRHNIRQFLLALGFSYLALGIVVLICSVALPYFITSFVPKAAQPVIGDQLNLFVDNSVSYYYMLSRKFGWVYLLIAIISFLIWRWHYLNALQVRVDEFLNKKSKVESSVANRGRNKDRRKNP